MEMDRSVITRDEARAKGDLYYFTGKKCTHGHIADRLVSNRHCTECTRQSRKSGRPDGKTYDPNAQASYVLPLMVGDDRQLPNPQELGLTAIGLEPGTKRTLKQWRDCVKIIGIMGSGRQWNIGDLWNDTETGSKEDVMAAEGINPKTGAQYGWVCKVFPHGKRRHDVYFTHYLKVAASEVFTKNEARLAAIDHIADNKFTVSQTEAWLKKSKPTSKRLVVDPVLADLRVVQRMVKDIDIIPAEVANKIRELKELLESS